MDVAQDKLACSGTVAPQSGINDSNLGSFKPLAFAAASVETFRLAAKVAKTDVAVLINGESGTGKEVVARYVHQCSPRAKHRLVAVNCAAIPENMLETTLFGHEKGAFTGAVGARQGKFMQADGGTLLLDEVSEMPVSLQAKLLRAIQEQEIEPLGGREPRKVNVRILATSNRNLPEAIAAGDFREDLYYRLSVFPLNMAPLRQRLGDIWPLAQFLAEKHQSIAPTVVGLAESCRGLLEGHAWPGNVRELENVVQRGLVVCAGTQVLPTELGLAEPVLVTAETQLGARLEQTEQDTIVSALAEHQGNRRATAAALGVSERTLRYKLARLRSAGLVLS